jgi:quinol monooxygenase YgiN
MYTYLLDFTLAEETRDEAWDLVRDRIIPMLRGNGAVDVTLRRNTGEPGSFTLVSQWLRHASLRRALINPHMSKVVAALQELVSGTVRQAVQEQVSFNELYGIADCHPVQQQFDSVGGTSSA